MYCVKCGATLPEKANFCPNCGEPVRQTEKKTSEVKTAQFRCKGCGHVMEIDPDSPVLRCSVCGSNELILEGDDVTVQRIKSNAYKDIELGKQQTYKEVELGKKELEIKENTVRFKRHILSYIIIIAGAVGTYWGFVSVSPVGLLIGIIVLIAGIASTRFSKKAPKEEKHQPEVNPPSEHYAPREYNDRHATKEDIELARVHAKEKGDKRALLVAFLTLLLCLGGLFLMYFIER